MSLKTNSRVAVIGSGISSLTFSYLLSKLRPDVKITVLEESRKSSGYIQSEIHNINREKIVLEKGPRTLRGSSDGSVLIVDILRKLGKEGEIKYISRTNIANKKYLLSPQNKPVQVPDSFLSFINFWRNGFMKGVPFGILKEPFVKKSPINDESIDSFFSRRISQNLTRNIISAVYHGIYAGDVRKLSMLSIMPTLKELETKYGSIIRGLITRPKVETAALSPELERYNELFQGDTLKTKNDIKSFPMLTFKNGLETFTGALYNDLSTRANVSFKFNEPVTTITNTENGIKVNDTEYDLVRSSVRYNILSSVLPPNTLSLKQNVNYVDILLINVFIKKDLMPFSGFGYLVPLSNKNENSELGCIFDSEIEKNSEYLYNKDPEPVLNKDYTKLTLMFGGHYYSNKKPNVTDEYIHNLVQETLQSHLGINIKEHKDSTYVSYKYLTDCIPQFEVGYNDLKTQFHSQIHDKFQGKLIHGGMTFGDGIGVPDVVMNSYRHVLKLL